MSVTIEGRSETDTGGKIKIIGKMYCQVCGKLLETGKCRYLSDNRLVCHDCVASPVLIEPGKYYRTRNGEKRYVVGLSEEGKFVLQSRFTFYMSSHDSTGICETDHGCDLVAEWKEETQEEKDAKAFAAWFLEPHPVGYEYDRENAWHAACKYARANIPTK